MLTFPLGDYETAEDFAAKIDWEGGVAEFFLHYTNDDFKGTPLEKPLKSVVG